uniref:Uncharacterized protein n=1 Tax=Anopheles coluzzii TaxID=1518534 RepID=A0A8W7Q0X4_ANOCL
MAKFSGNWHDKAVNTKKVLPVWMLDKMVSQATVRCSALVLVVLVFATSVVQSAPQKKFPFAKARLAAPEPEERASAEAVASSQEAASQESASEESLEKIQAKSAQYAYDTSVNDTINDHAIMRQEERNGLSLKGMYSYSDGFFKRTVHYEADDKGYRVVKEINIPIGNGPQVDPHGKADVSSSLTGSYSITADDIAKPQRKGVAASSEEAAASSQEEQPEEDPVASDEEKNSFLMLYTKSHGSSTFFSFSICTSVVCLTSTLPTDAVSGSCTSFSNTLSPPTSGLWGSSGSGSSTGASTILKPCISS